VKLGRFLVLIGSFVLLFTLGLAIFNFLIMPKVIHHNAVVATPDLRGKTVETARGEAGRAGLQLVEDRQVAHPTIAAGRIVEQTPRANASIRRGRRVLVVVSAGPAVGTVPDLAGLSRRQADMTLARESFRPGRLVRLHRDDVAAPTVVFQFPPPGSSQRREATVDLVVAEPGLPPAWRMPDLRGASLGRARAAVEAAGCVPGTVTFQRRPGVQPGTVLAQTPVPGSLILKGANVELVASAR
jgi:serine/threonine-protein kinase